MKKVLALITFSLLFSCNKNISTASLVPKQNFIESKSLLSSNINISSRELKEANSSLRKLYNDLDLSNKLDYEVFETAIKGRDQINKNKNSILAIIDFSKHSSKKRLFIIDLNNKKLVYNTYVAHGKNSGEGFSNEFSNELDSNQSSLGFFITENTYVGENGYSLKLEGLENGINNNAKSRAIVMHGADYATEEFIESNDGRLGRSLGCPAVPDYLSKEIIDYLKNGSVIFAYGNNNDYVKKSKFITNNS